MPNCVIDALDFISYYAFFKSLAVKLSRRPPPILLPLPLPLSVFPSPTSQPTTHPKKERATKKNSKKLALC